MDIIPPLGGRQGPTSGPEIIIRFRGSFGCKNLEFAETPRVAAWGGYVGRYVAGSLIMGRRDR